MSCSRLGKNVYGSEVVVPEATGNTSRVQGPGSNPGVDGGLDGFCGVDRGVLDSLLPT
jgi:hypothetical protein